MATRSPRLVLASGSPRRRELLARLGVTFSVRTSDVDESALTGESADDHVMRLARSKGVAVARPGELVLAADTVVVVDGDILGKPGNAQTARAMLRRLAGRRHEVLTGVILVADHSADPIGGFERSVVAMAPLSEQEIHWYVETGEPLDKAGAYAIQGLGALFVDAVFGNYSNVVGLPLPLTQRLFQSLGYDLRQFRDRPR